jgi:hypothetical protein
LGFNEHREGGTPVAKISDEVDPLAVPGNPEVSSVQRSPDYAIPDFEHLVEDLPEVRPTVAGGDAGNILPDNPAGTFNLGNPYEMEGKVPTRVIKP